jgi:hypothetical protein
MPAALPLDICRRGDAGIPISESGDDGLEDGDEDEDVAVELCEGEAAVLPASIVGVISVWWWVFCARVSLLLLPFPSPLVLVAPPVFPSA